MRCLDRILLAMFATALTAANSSVLADDVSFEDAMAAPAMDLAQAYLFVSDMLEHTVPMAAMGMTVHLGDETITEDNAEQYRARFQRRLEIYEHAIQERGTRDLAGTYTADATESCERAGTSWAGLIFEGHFDTIRVRQDGIRVSLVIDFTYEGQQLQIEMRGATLEESAVFADSMNSDYFVRGLVNDTGVELRPDARVLASWPPWAGPPQRTDIENCIVLLTRRPDKS